MPRRSLWLVTGAVAGAASSLYAERRLRRTLEAASARLQPEALVGGMGRTARRAADSTGARVREAVSTGRDAMRRREEELWADLTASGEVATPGGYDAPSPADPGPVATDTHHGPGDAAAVDAPVRAAGDRRRRRTRRSPSHLGK